MHSGAPGPAASCLPPVSRNEIRPPALLEVVRLLAGLSYRRDDPEAFLSRIAEGCARLLDIDWVAVTLNPDAEQEKVLASSRKDFDLSRVFSYHGTVAGQVLASGRAQCVRDIDQEPGRGALPEGYRAYLGVPLEGAEGQAFGTVCCFQHRPRTFTEQETEVVTLFAQRAATAIDNYHLYHGQVDFNRRLEEEVAARTRELEEARERLVESERLAAIGQFAAGIVHEVRTPLSTVGMVLEYLAALDLNPAARKRLVLAQGEAHRLARLLTEILLYAKPSELAFTRIDVTDLLTTAAAAANASPFARERSIAPVLPAEDPPGAIRGDRDKLRQVLGNLLRNACEAAPAGSVVHLAATAAADGIRLTVTNPGPPIPPEVLPHLTEPFFSRKAGGTGLGLAIVERIVAAHQGNLTFRSNAEQGTTVTVALPPA